METKNEKPSTEKLQRLSDRKANLEEYFKENANTEDMYQKEIAITLAEISWLLELIYLELEQKNINDVGMFNETNREK